MINNILLSYPRSGNHLVRFFIELLSETPTYGCIENITDLPIYKNEFIEHIPFNIVSSNDSSNVSSNDSSNDSNKKDKTESYTKYHTPPNHKHDNLIFIIRNPKEVLLRNCNYKIDITSWDSYETYFNLIDYYINFTGNKICFFYEDIITYKLKFIEELYNFLHIKNESKKQYILENIEKLYELSKTGKNRDWGGVTSNSINFYYNKINIHTDKHDNFKYKFDTYIKDKIDTQKYNLIKNKYDL